MKHKIHYNDYNSYYNIAIKLEDYIKENTIIICIGTDKCIGDCLGPLVGTFLEESSFPVPVYGTLESPIHALNIDKKIDEIKKLHPQATIIGIDACLGDANSIGEIHVRDYPIHPGKGVGKSLPEVGVSSIIGIVDSSDNAEFFTSRGIRLSLVFEMARVICHGLNHAYYLNSSYNK